MTSEFSIESVKQKHTGLYERAIRDSQTSSPDKPLLDEVEELLNELRLCSGNVNTLDDYRWLSQAAVQWQVVYSSKWNIAKTVEIPAPPRTLLQPLPSVKTLSEVELENWRSRHAEYLGLLRLAKEKRESSEGEKAWDWHQAQVLLVSDILDGFPNFAGRIAPESYWRLEDVWLKAVKLIRAYFVWEIEGKTLFDLPRERENYDRACEHIRQMLVDDHIKAQVNEFGAAKAYLENRYLTDGRVLHEGSDEKSISAKKLIGTKAYRIKERRKEVESDYVESPENNVANWLRAETYVRLFYENIIPAVVKRDRISVLRVLKAFQYSKAPENCWWVINCFETALAIYFLDRKIINSLWEDSKTDTVPTSYLDSSVSVSWPSQKFFNVPAICQDSFRFDGAQIAFRGVMTDEQKEALIKELNDKSYRKDIESLYRQSRLIPKETTL